MFPNVNPPPINKKSTGLGLEKVAVAFPAVSWKVFAVPVLSVKSRTTVAALVAEDRVKMAKVAPAIDKLGFTPPEI
ncbi:MAG: hypothetical protein AB4060_12180 [Crocosphaera sp.]